MENGKDIIVEDFKNAHEDAVKESHSKFAIFAWFFGILLASLK